MVLGYLPPPILEAVRIRPCAPHDLGASTAHVFSVICLHLWSPGMNISRWLQPCPHGQLERGSWGHFSGVSKCQMDWSVRVRRVSHTLGFRNAPDITPRARWEGGEKDAESLWGIRCLWCPILLLFTKPIAWNCHTSWGEKWILVPVRSATLVVSQFVSNPNLMDCGQRCMKMQSNKGQLWLLLMSKVEL